MRGARLGGVAHRYLVADGPGAVYLAFAGTQDARPPHGRRYLDPASRRSSSSAPRLMVHRGFAARAGATRASIAAAWRAARARQRLVLCGHSLGGAVAALAALTLPLELDHLDRDDRVAPQPGKTLLCAAFAAPPVGDESTRRYVERRGWTRAFINVCAPGRRAASPPHPRSPRGAVTSSDAGAAAGGAPRARAARDPSEHRRRRALRGRSLRPKYAHLVPPHRLHRGGRVVLAGDDDEPAGRRRLEAALIRHTMRAPRGCAACANAFPDPRDRSGAAWRETTARTSPEGSVVGKILPRRRFEASARSCRGYNLGFRPVGGERRPRAYTARGGGDDSPPGESSRSSWVTVADLCGRVTADVRGWPCVASVSSSSATRLVVYVSPPTFNGRRSRRGRGRRGRRRVESRSCSPSEVILGTRVAVRVVDERVDAETLGTRSTGLSRAAARAPAESCGDGSEASSGVGCGAGRERARPWVGSRILACLVCIFVWYHTCAVFQLTVLSR